MLEREPDGPIPRRLDLPDLSGLDHNLTANLVLSLVVGRGFPVGVAQHLVTAFVRTTEVSLHQYEAARLQLEAASQGRSLVAYLRGLDGMELTFMALNRAMRLAEALVTSHETMVRAADLPLQPSRVLLRKMRNAVDHREGPIKAGQAGMGKTLALAVDDHEITIDDDVGTLMAAQTDLADWIRQLHRLAVGLTNRPEEWARAP